MTVSNSIDTEVLIVVELRFFDNPGLLLVRPDTSTACLVI
jgi:hypothetical protein